MAKKDKLSITRYVKMPQKLQTAIARSIADRIGTKRIGEVKDCLRDADVDVQYNETQETVNIIHDHKADRLPMLFEERRIVRVIDG